MIRAALGQREDDDGTTCPIEPERARTARRQAARITAWSVVLGAAGAAAAYAIGRVVAGAR